MISNEMGRGAMPAAPAIAAERARGLDANRRGRLAVGRGGPFDARQGEAGLPNLVRPFSGMSSLARRRLPDARHRLGSSGRRDRDLRGRE